MPDRQVKFTIVADTTGQPAVEKLTDATDALGQRAQKTTKDFQTLDGVVSKVSKPQGDFGLQDLNALPIGLTKASAAVDPLIAKFRQAQQELSAAQKHVDALFESELKGTAKVNADRQHTQQRFGSTPELRRRIDEFYDKRFEEARHEEHRSLSEKVQATVEDFAQHPFNAIGRRIAAGAEAIGPVGTTIVAGAGAAALALAELSKHAFELVHEMGEAAEQTEHLGIRLGITSHEASALSAEARIVGVDVNTLAGGARYLSEALEDASGTGQKTAKALSQLGIQSLDPVTGKAREMGKVFEDVLEKLSAVQDTNKRTFLAGQIFPRGAAKELLPLIDSYKRAKEELADIGGGQPDELIKTLADGEEQIHKMGVAYDFFKAKLAAKLEPIVVHFVGDFTKLLSDGKHRLPAAIATSLFGPFAGDIFEPLIDAKVNGTAKPVGPEPPPGYTDAQKADFERGRRLASQSNSRFLNNTPEGLRFQLTQNEKDLQEAQSAVTSAAAQGISTHAADELIHKRDNLTRVVDSLKKRIKALDEAPQIIEEYNRKVEETRQKLFQLQHPASRFGDIPRILGEEALFNFNLTHDEKTKGNLPLQRRYQALERPLFQGELQAEAEAEGLKFHERQNQLATIEDKGNLDALKRSFDLQEKLAKLQSSPDDPVRGIELINEAYRHQLEISEKLYEADARRAVQYVSSKDPKFAQLIAEINASKIERDDQARNENVIGSAEINKQTKERADRADEEINRLRSEAGLDALSRRLSFQQHLATLGNEGIETPSTILAGLQSQLQLASAIKAQHLDDNRSIVDINEKRKADELVLRDYQKETDDARLQAAEKYLDLQQQGIAQAKQSAGELFNALRTDPLGPGHGASEFFKGQGNKILENLFSNAAAPIFKTVGQSLNGALPTTGPLAGLFKNIFHGTAFDDPVSATKENTDALKDLTSTLRGKGANASGAPGFDSIPGTPVSPLVYHGIKDALSGLFHHRQAAVDPSNLPYRIPDATTLPNLNDVSVDQPASDVLPLSSSNSRLDAIHATLSEHLANSLNQIKPVLKDENHKTPAHDPIVTELRRVQKTIEVGTPDGSTPSKSPNGFVVAGQLAGLVPPIRSKQPGQPEQTLASDVDSVARVLVPRVIAPTVAHAMAQSKGFAANSPLSLLDAAKHYLVDVPTEQTDKSAKALSQGDYRGFAVRSVKAVPGAAILPDFLESQRELARRAHKDFTAGHPIAGALHGLGAIVPVEGPELSNIYDHYRAASNSHDPFAMDEVAGELGGVAVDVGIGALEGKSHLPRIPSRETILATPPQKLHASALDQVHESLSDSLFLEFLGSEPDVHAHTVVHPANLAVKRAIHHTISSAQKQGFEEDLLRKRVPLGAGASAQEQDATKKEQHPATLAPTSDLISPHGFAVAGDVAALDPTPALELLAGAVDHKPAVVREGLGPERYAPPSLGLKIKGDLPKPHATPRTVTSNLVDAFLSVDDLPSVIPLIPRYLHDIPVEQYGKAKDAFSKGQNALGVGQLIGGIPGAGMFADILQGQHDAFVRGARELQQAPHADGALNKFGAYSNAIGDMLLSAGPLVGPNVVATTDELISGDPDTIAEGVGHIGGYVVSDLVPFLGVKGFLQEAKLHPAVSATAKAAAHAKTSVIETAARAKRAGLDAATRATTTAIEHITTTPEYRAIRAADATQPATISPFTGTPIYLYKGSRGPLSSGVSGFFHPETGRLFLDQRRPAEQIGATFKHEAAHDILHPYLDTVAASRPALDLEPKVQDALAQRSQTYYGHADPNKIYNEGFAYGIETGRVPGLTIPESQRFVESILDTAATQGHPELRAQTRRLYEAQPAQLARLVPTPSSPTQRFVQHLRNSNLLHTLRDETGSFGPQDGRDHVGFPYISGPELFSGDSANIPPAIHYGLADEPPLPAAARSGYAPLGDEPVSAAHGEYLRRLFGALRDDSGSFGPGSGLKRDRAVLSYKPSTQTKQLLADQSEAQLSKALGIPRTSGNAPFDLQNEKYGIEIKTLVDNDHDKITMHKESLARKLKAADENQLHPYTIAVDKRGASPAYYYRDGLGSFRIPSMTRVPSLGALKNILFDETGSFGPGSGYQSALEPRIFNTPEDLTAFKSWGETRIAWKDKTTGEASGQLLTGEPLDRAKLPEYLYHVTTNAKGVRNTGLLLGQLGDAGLGGGQAPGVSFTTDPADARVIQRELQRSIRIARGEDKIDAIQRYAREDETEAGLPPQALQRGVDAARYGYDVNTGSSYYHDHPEKLNLSSSTADAFNQYLISRDIDFGKTKPVLKNPILFGDRQKLATVDPQQVQTLRIPSRNIPEGALVTTGSDSFLHEVRAYSDVPVKDTTVETTGLAGVIRRMLADDTGSFGPDAGRHPKRIDTEQLHQTLETFRSVTKNDAERLGLDTLLDAPPDPTHDLKDQVFTPFTGSHSYNGELYASIDDHIAATGSRYRELLAKAPVHTVNLDKLYALQNTVSKTVVERTAQNINNGKVESEDNQGNLSLPVVVKLHGKQYIFDGNHRLSAYRLGGVQEAEAKIIDLDTEKPPSSTRGNILDALKDETGSFGPGASPTWLSRSPGYLSQIPDKVTGGDYSDVAEPDKAIGFLAAHLPALPISAAALQATKSPEATEKNTQALTDLTAALLKANAAASGTGDSSNGGFIPTAGSTAVDQAIQGSLPSAPAYNGPESGTSSPAPSLHPSAANHKPTPTPLSLAQQATRTFAPLHPALGPAADVLGNIRNLRSTLHQGSSLKRARTEAAFDKLPVSEPVPLTLPNLDLPQTSANLSPSGFPTLPQNLASIGDIANQSGILSGNAYSDQSPARPDSSTLAPGLYDLPKAPAFPDTPSLDQTPTFYTQVTEPLEPPPPPPEALPTPDLYSYSPSSVSPEGIPTFKADAVQIDNSQDGLLPASLPQSVLDAANPFNSPLTGLSTLNTGLQGLAAGFKLSGLGTGDSSGSSDSSDSGDSSSSDSSGPTALQRTGKFIGQAATLTAGVLGAIAGFKKGGLKGDLAGTTSILGTAAALDPEPISKAVLGIATGVTAMINAFLPDPRAQRERQLARELENARIAAEPYTENGVNIEATTTGHLAVDNFLGNVTDTKLHPDIYKINQAIGFDPLHPDRVVTQPYRVVGGVYTGGSAPAPYGYENDLTNPLPKVPGAGSLADLSQGLTATVNPPSQSSIIINNHLPVHGIDSKDIIDRANDFADALSVALQSNHRVNGDIRFITSPV